MSNPLSYQDALKLIKESSTQKKYKIYIPSLKDSVECYPMNAIHYKQLIEVPMHGMFSDNKFSQTMFSIYKDIFVDSSQPDKFTIFDKIWILFQLRMYNIDEDIKVTSGDRIISIPIKSLVDRLKNNPEDIDIHEQVSHENYKVDLYWPSIREDFAFERTLYEMELKALSNSKESDTIKKLPAIILTYDVVKYVKSIHIEDNIIDCTSLSILDRVSLFDSLPSKLISKIIKKIDSTYGELLLKNTTMDDGLEIPTDVSLFL